MPVLPLIRHPGSYRPCIQNLLTDGEETREYWLQLFERHGEQLARLPVNGGRLDGHPGWNGFRRDFLKGIASLREQPDQRGELTVLEMTRYRDEKLAAHQLGDPFAILKERENTGALKYLPSILEELDAAEPALRLERLVQGLFAGNLFDMGSEAAIEAFEAGDAGFVATRDRLRPRPWAVDDLDTFQAAISRSPYRQALFFVDNAGSDILLGVIPFVRWLAGLGTRVVLTANSRHALNDVTAEELTALLPEIQKLDRVLDEQVRSGLLSVVPSGCTTPLIDLADLTEACCEAATQSDLLILEGMGRAIESNYDAHFTVDTIKVALIKDPMVAGVIGTELFDPVFRFDPVEAPQASG